MRRSVQSVKHSRRAGRVQHDGIEYQHIGISRQPGKRRMSGGIYIAAEGDAVAQIVDAVDYTWRIAMVSGESRDGQTIRVQQNLRLRAVLDIVRVQRQVTGEVPQITEGAVRPEHEIDELC